MAASQPEYMKQAMSIPPIRPFIPPMPGHENQSQRKGAAAAPFHMAAPATPAASNNTAYSKITMDHSNRATTFSPKIANAVPKRFQRAPTVKIAAGLSISDGASKSSV